MPYIRFIQTNDLHKSIHLALTEVLFSIDTKGRVYIMEYEDEKQIFVESISHSADEIAKYDLIVDQYEFRKDMIMEVLKEKNVKLEELTGIVARGGLLPPLQAGAYRVNDDMVWQLKNKPAMEHASNLGAIIADASQTTGNTGFYL